MHQTHMHAFLPILLTACMPGTAVELDFGHVHIYMHACIPTAGHEHKHNACRAEMGCVNG